MTRADERSPEGRALSRPGAFGPRVALGSLLAGNAAPIATRAVMAALSGGAEFLN